MKLIIYYQQQDKTQKSSLIYKCLDLCNQSKESIFILQLLDLNIIYVHYFLWIYWFLFLKVLLLVSVFFLIFNHFLNQKTNSIKDNYWSMARLLFDNDSTLDFHNLFKHFHIYFLNQLVFLYPWILYSYNSIILCQSQLFLTQLRIGFCNLNFHLTVLEFLKRITQFFMLIVARDLLFSFIISYRFYIHVS
jgi:hypothetical protein